MNEPSTWLLVALLGMVAFSVWPMLKTILAQLQAIRATVEEINAKLPAKIMDSE
jgi:hypothetical protein